MMSLLEKASIITTPTAYDDGKLLSVKPKGGENLLLQSNQFDTTWSTNNASVTSGQTGYDGSNSAWLLERNSPTNKIIQTKTTSGVQTFSFYAKANTKSWVKINNLGTQYRQANFNLSNGTIGITTNIINADIQDVGNGWYRCSATYVDTLVQVDIRIADGNNVFTDSTGSVYIQDAQLERGKKANTYIETTTTAIKNGDFSFQRGSSATRVNEQGLVSDVQILSGELVQNGDFEQIGSEQVSNGDFEQIGSELVVNGDFATDSDWTKQIGWTIADGSASYDASGNSALTSASTSIVLGKIYRLKFKITTSGFARLNFTTDGSQSLFQPNGNSLNNFADGEYTFYLSAQNNSTALKVFAYNVSGGTSFSIDNVSVKEVGQDWTFGTGWSISGGKASCDGTNIVYLTQTGILNTGTSYKVQFDIVDYTSGSVKYRDNGLVSGQSFSGVGSYTDYVTAGGGQFRLMSENFIGSVDNISVKEVGQNWEFNSTAILTANGMNITTYGYIRQDVVTIGKSYKLTYDIFSYTSGDIRLYDGTNQGNLPTSIGSNTFNFIAGGSLLYIQSNSANVNLVITNISVIEITDDTDLPRINYTNFDYKDVLGDELVTNGSFDTDSDWSKGAGWSISGGKANVNATSFTDLYQNIGTVVGKTYKISFEVSNYVSGSVKIILGYGSTPELPLLVATSNGVYEVETTPNAINPQNIYISTKTANTQLSIDNVSVKELTEDVLVPYSGEGSLLLEPQSTNLITYSEDFTQWTNINATISTNQSISPDGTLNADKLIATSGASNKVIYQAISAGTYTASVFAKKGEFEGLFIGTGTVGAFFNLNTYAYRTHYASPPTSYQIESYGNGWYRYSITFTESGSNNLYIGPNDNVSTTLAVTGDGSKGIYIYGAMLEQNSFSTSYIPTKGSIKTRLQDVCNNAGSSDLINSTEGVLYAEISALDLSNYLRELSISDGTTSNRIQLRYYDTSDNKIQSLVVVGGSTQASALITLSNAKEFNKIAFLYKQNDFRLFVNGIKVFTDTSGSTFSANTLSELSFDRGGGGNPFNGNVKCVAVFKEALSDSELACLTS